MKIARFFALIGILVLAFWTGCSKKPSTELIEAPQPINKFENPKLRKIYDLADRREVDSLLPYLDDSIGGIRVAAAIVFGSVQDVKAGPKLESMLSDENPDVVVAAAWAIGQLGDSTYCGHLLEAMQRSGGDRQCAIGEALGKAGSNAQLADAMDKYTMGTLPSGTGLALTRCVYRAGLRKRVPAGAQALALSTLEVIDAEAQLYAAAFLGRVAESGPIAAPDQLLKPMQQIENDDVRQLLVRAFARCADTACTAELRKIAMDTSETPMTRVNAFRGAGMVHDLLPQAMAAVHDASEQVSVAAAEYIDLRHAGNSAEIEDLSRKISSWRTRALLLKTAIREAVAVNPASVKTVTQYVDSLLAKANLYEQGALYTALATDKSQHARLMEITVANKPILSIYAFEAYLDYYKTPMRDNRPLIHDIEQAMATGDPGLIAMGAEYISNAELPLISQITRTAFLDSAIGKLHLPEDIEAHNAVLKAQAKLNGNEYVPAKLGFQHPIDWSLVQRIPSEQTAEIMTSRGKIVLQLKVNDAPGTVANFVELVQSGFYKAKKFHRIVPAFVAQGGCPRGDGWGSSPQTIRSEWAPLRYFAGAVGMASAGKDTESCQWFITHCSVPHLDGRYTIFADVIEGMNVVQVLQIGDEIIGITLPGL